MSPMTTATPPSMDMIHVTAYLVCSRSSFVLVSRDSGSFTLDSIVGSGLVISAMSSTGPLLNKSPDNEDAATPAPAMAVIVAASRPVPSPSTLNSIIWDESVMIVIVIPVLPSV